MLEWNYQLPTVLQSLTYWMASAMELHGAWAIPEVGAEPAYSTSETPCSVYDVIGQNPAAAMALSLL